MPKVWDTSPIDPWSFDPTQPPLAGPAPVNTAPPTITPLSDLTVGATVVCTNGTWIGASTYARIWTHNGAAIPGATLPSYVLDAAFIGEMIGATVIGWNAGGSTSASADEVGPVEAAAPMTRGRAKVPPLRFCKAPSPLYRAGNPLRTLAASFSTTARWGLNSVGLRHVSGGVDRLSAS